ncbi:MAG: hypothetical protein K5678_05190 [Acetatifactor sp.]|nr:hypothetical protein [Acetatifactor sp.]
MAKSNSIPIVFSLQLNTETVTVYANGYAIYSNGRHEASLDLFKDINPQLNDCDAFGVICLEGESKCSDNRWSKTIPVDHNDPFNSDIFNDTAKSIEESFIERDTYQALHDELSKLTSCEQETIYALISCDFKDSQASQKLGVPRTTLSSRRDKIYQKLRKSLKNWR